MGVPRVGDPGGVPSGGDQGEGLPGRPPIGELLAGYDDLDEGWRSKIVKKELQQAYYEWLAGSAKWKSFLTLTFEQEKAPDVAYRFLLRLIQVLNFKLFGNNYVQKVGHSYFNYVVGMEFQVRDVVHFHMLVDRPVNYQLVQSWWKTAAGFAWIEKVQDQAAALRYVTKYLCKGGDQNINVFLKAKGKDPRQLPLWWFE